MPLCHVRIQQEQVDLTYMQNMIVCWLQKSWTRVSTAVRLRIPKKYYGKISPRSGLAFRSNIFAFESTIDSDDTGEIIVLLKNDRNSMFMINKNDRIAQIIIVSINQRNWMRIVQHSEFPQTKRGSGGFGSTGRKEIVDQIKIHPLNYFHILVFIVSGQSEM